MNKTILFYLVPLLVLVACGVQYQTYTDGSFSVNYPKWHENNQAPNANVVVNVNDASCAVQIQKIAIGAAGFQATANFITAIAEKTGQFTLINKDITSDHANIDYKTGINNVVYQSSVRAKSCGQIAYAVFFACKEDQFSKNAEVMNQVFGSMKC